MLGKLTGIVDYIKDSKVLLDVSGVGYWIYTHTRYICTISIGDRCSFIIEETHGHDGVVRLYGFMNHEERELACMLTKTNGVSFKIVMSILNTLGVNDVVNAIANQQTTTLKVPGVGEKIATRIINEFSKQIEKISIVENQSQSVIDAISALMNLGYQNTNVRNVVQNLYNENKELDSQDLIKLSLKVLYDA